MIHLESFFTHISAKTNKPDDDIRVADKIHICGRFLNVNDHVFNIEMRSCEVLKFQEGVTC